MAIERLDAEIQSVLSMIESAARTLDTARARAQRATATLQAALRGSTHAVPASAVSRWNAADQCATSAIATLAEGRNCAITFVGST